MNSGSTPPPPPPPPGGTGGSQTPSDYYAQPPASGEVAKKSNWGKWALGCGGAGCLLLIIVLAIGGYFVTRGAASLIGFVFDEIETLASNNAGITAEERAEFKEALGELKKNLQSKDLSLPDLQPLMDEANAAIRDKEITQEEIDQLIETMKRLNQKPAEESF